MRKKKTNNISSEILANGISEDGFNKLLNDIKNAINSGRDALNENGELINELRNSVPSDNTDEWIERFNTQVAVSNNVIDENLKNMENLFERIFNDWQEYKKNSVIEEKGDANE